MASKKGKKKSKGMMSKKMPPSKKQMEQMEKEKGCM